MLGKLEFEEENLHKKTEFKVYSLMEHGPKIPKGLASDKNVDAFEKILLANGGTSDFCTPILRFPTSKDIVNIFDTVDLLTSTAGPARREAYHVHNLKFLGRWLTFDRTFDSTPVM